MSARRIVDLEQHAALVAQSPALLLLVGSEQCGVCQALRPRIEALIECEFPRLAYGRVEIEEAEELCGQLRLFQLPLVVLYFDGRERVRLGGSFSLAALREAIARPYNLLFTTVDEE